MRAPEVHLSVLPVWGVGPTLYSPNGAGGFVIGHDGGNYPAINTTARIDPTTGDDVIVLETGSVTVAREIGDAWLHWQTGTVGLDTLSLFDLPWILLVFGLGALVIAFA